MKVGIRKPSLKKSISARTTGKMKREVKKAVIPAYGEKGTGWIKDPKKAAYNKIYNKTTVSVIPSMVSVDGKKVSSPKSSGANQVPEDPDTKKRSVRCPHCTATFFVDPSLETVECEYCGSEVHIEHTPDEHLPIENVQQVYTYEASKKRRTWLWVLGWIFCFPIPLALILTKKENMAKPLKVGLIALAAIFYLFLIYPSDISTDMSANITGTSSEPSASAGEAISIDASAIMTSVTKSIDDSVDHADKYIEDAFWDSIEFTQTTETLEYSDKSVDPLTLVTCSDPDMTVSTSGTIDLTKIGKQKVKYELANLDISKNYEFTFDVKDTKGPEISCAQQSITITEGDSFDAAGNISSVDDPVDGALTYTSAEEPGPGEYTIQGYYDANSSGTYEIKVIAKDKNGNQSSDTFNLTVNEPVPVAAAVYDAPSTETSGGDYVINTNTGKFHHTWCSSVDQMNPENRWDVHMTRDEIIGMGYVPCKRCNP